MTTAPDEALTAEQHAQSSRRPLWQRLAMALGAMIAVIVLLGGVLYFFGGPGGSVYDPRIGQEYDRLLESGEITPVQRQFVVPIPGCTCHSTDPRLTEEHRFHRMSECMDSGCHG